MNIKKTKSNNKKINTIKFIGPPPPKTKDILLNRRENIRKFYISLNTSQRLYLYTFILLTSYFFCKLFLNNEISRSALILFILQLSCTVIYDFLKIYKFISSTVIGKAVLMIIFSLGVTFSLAISSQLINEITSIDPLKFPKTLTFLSIMMVPVLFVPSLLVIQILVISVSPILFSLYSMTNGDLKKFISPEKNLDTIKFNKLTKFIQFLSFLLFIAIFYSLGNKFSPAYNKFLERSASWFIFNMEMYPKAHCKIGEGKRATFISDQIIAVGVREGNRISLVMQDCKQGQ